MCKFIFLYCGKHLCNVIFKSVVLHVNVQWLWILWFGLINSYLLEVSSWSSNRYPRGQSDMDSGHKIFVYFSQLYSSGCFLRLKVILLRFSPFNYSSIYSFFPQIASASHALSLDYDGRQNRWRPCLHTSHIVRGKTDLKQLLYN